MPSVEAIERGRRVFERLISSFRIRSLKGAKLRDIKEIFAEGEVDINYQSSDGETALMVAAEIGGDSAIVDFLLSKGANPDLQDEKGETALMKACKEARRATTKALLEGGAKPNLTDIEGETAVMKIGSRLVSDGEIDAILRIVEIRKLNLDLPYAEDIVYYGIIDDLIERAIVVVNEAKAAGESEESKLRNFVSEYDINAMVTDLAAHGADLDVRKPEPDGRSAVVLASNSTLRGALLGAGASRLDLMERDPDYSYFRDRYDHRSIFCTAGDHWKDFSRAIAQSVKNHEIGGYPFVKANDDATVSFFFDDDIDGPDGSNEFYNARLREGFEKDFIRLQFEFQAREFGLGKKEGLFKITTNEAIRVTEVKINLSATELDSILKQNSTYAGYRNEGSLVKLDRDYELKPGVVRLFPVYEIGEGRYALQAAGCQLSEMPTLQLMRLLPNYEDEIVPKHKREGFRFHWVPTEVMSVSGLSIARKEFSEVLLEGFGRSGVAFKIGERIVDLAKYDEGPEVFAIVDKERLGPVRVVEMDEASKDFYVMYGNCSREGLGACKSVEVRTLDLLKWIKENLEEREKVDKGAIANIDEMIRREKERESATLMPLGDRPGISPSPSDASVMLGAARGGGASY